MVKNKYLKNITRNATQKEITPENRGVLRVGLSEANSNKYRTLLELKASIDPTAIVSPPAQDGQVVTELKQHPRYLSEEEIQEAIC